MGIFDFIKKQVEQITPPAIDPRKNQPKPPDPLDRVPIRNVNKPLQTIRMTVNLGDNDSQNEPSEPFADVVNADFHRHTYRQERTRVMTLDPPEPCGFNFDHVQVTISRNADKDSGEVFGEHKVVTLEGDNLQKVENDLWDIAPFADQTKKLAPNWIDLSRFLDVMGVFDGPGTDDLLHLQSTLEILPLTPTGKTKSMPIEANICLDVRGGTYFDNYLGVVDNGQDTLIAHLGYKKDGSIGKAQIITWHEHNGTMCNIATNKDGMYIKSIKVCQPIYEQGERIGTSSWVQIYPQKR